MADWRVIQRPSVRYQVLRLRIAHTTISPTGCSNEYCLARDSTGKSSTLMQAMVITLVHHYNGFINHNL